MEAYGLHENYVTRWKVDWTRFYGQLPSGRYRYVKEFTDFHGSGDYDDVDFYAEFVIDEVHECCDENGDSACDICGKSLAVYRVVGNTDWMGYWDAANDLGIMEEVETGVYRKVFEDVPPGAYELRITKNGRWDAAYGNDGQNYIFVVDETSTVTVDFRLRGDEGVISVYGQGRILPYDGDEEQDRSAGTADLTVGLPAVLLLLCATAALLLLRKGKAAH